MTTAPLPAPLVSPLRLEPAVLEVGLALEAGLARDRRRARCVKCRQRRVLYRIQVAASVLKESGATEARCLECWGVRP